MSDHEIPDLQADLDEALLGLEELIQDSPDEAISMFESLPEEVKARPEFQLTLARAHQANEKIQPAVDLARGVLGSTKDQNYLADAHHLLGDLLEDLGDTKGANEHFLETLHLDSLAYEDNSTLDADILLPRLKQLAAAAVKQASPTLAERIHIQVELFPTSKEVEDGVDPRALSRFERKTEGDFVFTLFAANIDAEFGDLEEFGEFDEHVNQALLDDLQELKDSQHYN